MRLLVGTEGELLSFDGTTREVLAEGPVPCIAVEDGSWLAIAEDHIVLRSNDAGDVGRIRGLTANCLIADGDGALVGTSEAHLVRAAGGSSQRVQSFDRVPTRDTWYTPWGGPPDTRSLTRDAGGAMFANVHVGGILRSDDGRAWRPTAMDVDADVHQVLAHPNESGLVYAATAIGLASSTDAGDTWGFEDDGLHAAYCRAVAVAGDTLLLSASRSHTGRQAALYRRAIAGGVFERCTRGLPEWFADNVDTHCVHARDSDAVVGTSDGSVYVSADAGASWERVLDGERPVRSVALL